MKKENITVFLLDVAIITVGCAAFAIGFDVFLDPNSIAPGGVTGLAMIICRYIPVLPVGAAILLINLPLFIAGRKAEGRGFFIKSLYGTVVSSAMIDIFAGRYEYTEDPMLASIYGGVLLGVGLGLVFWRGASTGGTDIGGKLLLRKFPHISLGKLMLFLDVLIIAAAAAVFGHINFALRAAITVYISSIVIDAIIYGADSAQAAYVITSNTREVVEAIDRELDRGATLLHGEGSYTGDEKRIILCAIKKRQVAALKRLVSRIDPDAFVIISPANEVLGDGFKS